MGCRQVVRHSTLTAVFAGSSPATPAKKLGGLVERLNTPVLKTGKGINSVFRGFESHTLFQNKSSKYVGVGKFG